MDNLIRSVLLGVFAVFVAGCTDPLTSSFYRQLDYAAPGVTPVDGFVHVTVFFATNRNKLKQHPFFGADPSLLRFGSATVRIPRERPMGGGDQFVAMLDHRNDERAARIVGDLTEYADIDQFLAAVRAKNAFKPIVIHVHGFNVDFPGSIVNAATFAFDLGDAVVPVAFTWPAAGKFEQYFADENNAHLSAAPFATLLERLRARPTDSKGQHLLAHSMGSRVTLYALEALTGRGVFDTLSFAAPDVDAMEFKSLLATAVRNGVASRITVYVAERDIALRTSRAVHSRSFRGDANRGRAGQAAALIRPQPGCDTIDASLVEFSPTFHGYAGTNRTVLSDLYHLVLNNVPPERRNLYRASTEQGQVFWLLRP